MNKPTTAKAAANSAEITELVRQRISTAEVKATKLEVTDEERIVVRVVFEQAITIDAVQIAAQGPEYIGAVLHETLSRIEAEYAEAFAPYLADREQRLSAAIDQFQAERAGLIAEINRQRTIVDKLAGVES